MSRAYPWPLPALVRKYRWQAETYGPESPRAQATRGRMNAAMHRVPGDDKSPAAIAAHRALGREGYWNRSARKHAPRWVVDVETFDRLTEAINNPRQPTLALLGLFSHQVKS